MDGVVILVIAGAGLALGGVLVGLGIASFWIRRAFTRRWSR